MKVCIGIRVQLHWASCMRFFMIAILAFAAPVLAADQPARHYPLVAPGTENWPPPTRLRVVSSPDWSNYNIYPMAARRREQEAISV